MIKHVIAIVVLTIAIILTMSHVQTVLHALVAGHDWVSQMLTAVFSGGKAGNITRELLAALTIPFLIALIPAAFYWLAKRRGFPYFMNVVWVVWLIQTSALVIQYKMA
jgi:hypothetical protein